MQREDGHVKTEAEIRVMLSQAKKSLEVPQAGRGKEGFSIGDFEWTTTLLTLHFRLLASKTMRKQILLSSHLPSLWYYDSPRK